MPRWSEISLRHALIGALAVTAVAATLAGGVATARAAGVCVLPATSTPLVRFGDFNPYFGLPGGNFETGAAGWSLSGGAAVVGGNEPWYIGSQRDAHSLALATTASSATTPTFCVTTDAPSFRMFIKNNGSLGRTDGQLAVYLNSTGADGRPQQVKIAALTGSGTSWTLTPSISFIQYLSTPLKTGLANISFTIRPNDTHGNWQIDDVSVDPYCSR